MELNYGSKIKKSVVLLVLLTMVTPTVSFSAGKGPNIQSTKGEKSTGAKRSNFAMGLGGTVIAGGAVTAGALAGMSSAGMISLGVGAVSAVAGATAGFGILGAAVAGGLVYGAYKLNDRYKTMLMAISSEDREKLSKMKLPEGMTKKKFIEDYKWKKLDRACEKNGYDGGADRRLTEFREGRKTDLLSGVKGSKSLTAYDDEGVPTPYPYVTGYPHILVSRLMCKPIDNSLENDPILAEYFKKKPQGEIADDRLDKSLDDLFNFDFDSEPTTPKGKSSAHEAK